MKVYKICSEIRKCQTREKYGIAAQVGKLFILVVILAAILESKIYAGIFFFAILGRDPMAFQIGKISMVNP